MADAGSTLRQCARTNNLQGMQITLERLSSRPQELRAVVNSRDESARTSLMLAVLSNSREMVLLLIYNGADINLVSREVPKQGPQGTALHMAIQMRYLDVAEVLLTHGANPLLCSPAGRTCLDLALSQGVACEAFMYRMLGSMIKSNQVWSGDVNIKMDTLFTKYKTHIINVFRVVRTPEAPRIPNQPQLQMWMFCEGQLTARMWLDGSMMERPDPSRGLLGLGMGRVPFHAENIQRLDKGGRWCMKLKVAPGAHGYEALDALCHIVTTGQFPLPAGQYQAPAPHSNTTHYHYDDIPHPYKPSPSIASDGPPVRFTPGRPSPGRPSPSRSPSQSSFSTVSSATPVPYSPTQSASPGHRHWVPPHAASESGRSLSSDDGHRCVICLTSPRELGYLHGDSLHLGVCRDCHEKAGPRAPCPICRQPVERVLNVYAC